MGKFRIPGRGRIDQDRPVRFTFDGRVYEGCVGDSVASALLANGVHLVGRSFKYHRPRGILAAGSEEPNALIDTQRGLGRREPNSRATMQEIWTGLATESQNRWPNLRFDVGSVADRLHPMFPAGFYYKTFMWPRGLWDQLYEPIIRRAAGLGRAPDHEDPDHYASRYLHCDILVVGGGPAGIAAALTAGRTGATTVIVDEHAEMGGALLSEPDIEIGGAPCWEWLESALAELRAMSNVRMLNRTTAIGYYHENMIGLCQRVTDHLAHPPADAPRERVWRVRAQQVILAQGAIEKPLLFDGNDRPGIMLAGAAHTYLNRYGVAVGEEIAVLTSHDSAWYAAFDLADIGADVTAIIDLRRTLSPELLAKAAAKGIPVLAGHCVTTTGGRKRLAWIQVNPVQGDSVGRGQKIYCDSLLMCGGWTPSLHLFSQSKGALNWDADQQRFLPGEKTEECFVAGAGAGAWGIGEALRDGINAAVSAATNCGLPVTNQHIVVSNERCGAGRPQRELPAETDADHARAFVDFQNDVTAKDIRLAVREGMRSIEHVKRYTTNGMATDQGKTSNMNGLIVAAQALGSEVPAVGLTTFRPPYTPTSFGALAGYHKGEHFEVTRKTGIDDWAAKQGAVFEPVSLWRRARYFPKSGEGMHEAVARECRVTRKAVGIFDASTLGKIEVVGPDASEFLNRMYTNSWSKLKVGRCRYGILLGEDGFIRDDGVIGRISEHRFHVTTTTGGAPRVLNMMEDYLQTEWPDLQVWLTSTTEHWGVIALNGPNARRLLEPFIAGQDISAEAFPHMSVSECQFGEIPARLFRVSFTGELGFEVNVPARHARQVWEQLWEAGADHGICPYGTETMHVLRAEKGYIIVGQDTDGTVTPKDAGLEWAIGKNKRDFVGKRSLTRPDMLAPDRKQLVGLLTEDPKLVLEEGAQIVAFPNEPIPMRMIGHVTSSYWSEALGRSIALALVENGHGRQDQDLYVPLPTGTHTAKVTGTVFYDVKGERLKQ